MQVDVSHNDEKNGIELLFSEKLPKEAADYLERLGFTQTRTQNLKWCVKHGHHPAYNKYAKDLKEALSKGKPFSSVNIEPSFSPSEENIDHDKFSYVTISFLKGVDIEQESFIVFDSFKRVTTEIGSRYAKEKYGDSFKEIDVSPRNYKRKARTLLKEGKVVTGDQAITNQDDKVSSKKEPVTLDEKGKLEILKEFVEFREKRKSDFPEVVIEDHELPIQFNGWLRENHPDLIELKDEIWLLAPKFNLHDIVKWNSKDAKAHWQFIVLDPFPVQGKVKVIEALFFEIDNEETREVNESELELILSQDEMLGKYGINFKKVDELVKEVGSHNILMANSQSNVNGASFIKINIFKDNWEEQKIAKISLNRARDFIKNRPDSKESELWKLTQREYQEQKAIEKTGSPMVLDAKDRQDHEKIIEKALQEKLPVPEKVLEDYPWLIEDGQQNKDNSNRAALSEYSSFINAKEFASALFEEDDPFSYANDLEIWKKENPAEFKLTEVPIEHIPEDENNPSNKEVDFWKEKIQDGAIPPVILYSSKADKGITDIVVGTDILAAYKLLAFKSIPAIVWASHPYPHFTDYKNWYESPDSNTEESYSTKIGRPNDYVYEDFTEFEGDVIYRVEVQGEMTTSDAQGFLMVPANGNYVEDQWATLTNPTPIDAKEVANSLLNTELPKNSNSKKIERLFTQAMRDIPLNKVYRDYEEFESQVVYLIEKLGETSQHQAQQILIQPGNEAYVEEQFNLIKKTTPRDAKNTALVLLERPSTKEKDKPIDPLTNSSGVYTEETARDNLETIVVDLPAASKVEIEIKIAKGTDDLFRYGLHVQKNFGDHSGGGGYPSLSDPTFPSRSEALKSALGKALDELNTLHESEDSILNNEEKKKKLIAKAIVALFEYSKNVFEPNNNPSELPATSKAIAIDIVSRGVSVPNVLVPASSKEPFISGSIMMGDAQKIYEASPDIISVKDKDLSTASAVMLFELSQMPHPKDHHIEVNRGFLLEEWSKRGKSLLRELGFPTDLNYPYVNIHSGYKSVNQLQDILGERGDQWWSVVEHNRPIADLDKAVSFIESEVKRVDSERLELVNPQTKKPTGKNKDEFNKLTWLIDNLEGGKEIIKDYLSSSGDKPTPTEKPSLPSTDSDDYIDRVIAHMHDEYEMGKRVTKGQVEKLAAELKVPNMGKMWEAVELSWLLWYKMLYNEHSVIEIRLAKMIVFWHKIQPTYAYSDSSKEIYKQYSTPCPIAAIIAQYTLMGQAQSIFEPSAGNGLLVLGADPKKTHVNEIDKTRLESLKHQEFHKITNLNAAQPFPEEMTKAYDVVVTNPPFAKWDEDKFDKDYIIGKYFHNHIGLAGNIRLEHLMAGLALHTMKDTGRAAIIIMGHVYFGKDTFIAKYRPFFNWLYRHYKVDDVINMNSFKLYNKQGAIEKTMLILIGGRKATPKGVSPTSKVAAHLYDMVDSFEELWLRVSPHISYNINTVIKQLKIELGR